MSAILAGLTILRIMFGIFRTIIAIIAIGLWIIIYTIIRSTMETILAPDELVGLIILGAFVSYQFMERFIGWGPNTTCGCLRPVIEPQLGPVPDSIP
jgi:hypothetical protein